MMHVSLDILWKFIVPYLLQLHADSYEQMRQSLK